jgi:hypothetical protein
MLAAVDAKWTESAVSIAESPSATRYKPYDSYEGGKAYEALVFVQLNRANICLQTASSRHDAYGEPPSAYLTKRGLPAKGLTVEEACKLVTQLADKVKVEPGIGPRLMIVDRHPSHKSPEFERHVKDMGFDLKLLPPRSHDLSPLDSYFFAAVKHGVRTEVCSEKLHKWTDIAQLLDEKMVLTPSANHIRNYMLKLRACLMAKGRRFHLQYAELKQQLKHKQSAKKLKDDAGCSK